MRATGLDVCSAHCAPRTCWLYAGTFMITITSHSSWAGFSCAGFQMQSRINQATCQPALAAHLQCTRCRMSNQIMAEADPKTKLGLKFQAVIQKRCTHSYSQCISLPERQCTSTRVAVFVFYNITLNTFGIRSSYKCSFVFRTASGSI